MNDKAEIYLRILSDLPFMSAIFDTLIYEKDSFAGSLLFERILRERETIGLDKERMDRETADRQRQQEDLRERKSDD